MIVFSVSVIERTGPESMPLGRKLPVFLICQICESFVAPSPDSGVGFWKRTVTHQT